MPERKLPKLDADNMDTDGAVKLAERMFKAMAEEYKDVYKDYLRAAERVREEERRIRLSSVVQSVIDSMDDVISRLQENARIEYKHGRYTDDYKRVSKSRAQNSRNERRR